MRNIYLSIFLFVLSTQVSFGQKVFKVTEGELQFINRENGIIVKKDNDFYKLEIYANADTKNRTIEFRTNSTKITPQEYAEYKNAAENVFADEIIPNYDFNTVKKIKFVSIDKDEDHKGRIDEFLQYNDDIFASFKFSYNDYLKKYEVDSGNHSLFCYLDFGSDKKIIMTYDEVDTFIIPTKNKLKLIAEEDFESYKVVKKERKLSNKKNWALSVSNPKNEAYRVETLDNGKVQLVNYLNEKVIAKTYQKIDLWQFIVCYSDSTNIDLYNYHFKKLNTDHIRAVKISEYSATVQLLQNNKIKTIGLDGKKRKKKERFMLIRPPELDYNNYVADIQISKDSLSKSYTEKVFPLINNQNIETFFFNNNTNIGEVEIRNNTEQTIEDSFVYYKDKSGKYGVNNIGYFVNPNYKAQSYLQKYQDLDSAEGNNKKANPKVKFRKNNLYMYFPLQEDFKYKKLDDFQNNFARFELPNGQKGWLDLEGNEYLDQ